MSPGEFWQALSAHSDEKLADRAHIGELARGLAARVTNLFVAKNHAIRNVAAYWPMPWDDEVEDPEDAEVKRLSSLEGDDLQAEINRFLERINNG